MGLCMADVMPRMCTAGNTIALCAYPVGCIHSGASPPDQQDLWLCSPVGRPPTESGRLQCSYLAFPHGVLVLVVFRIPAWNLFLEIGEAQDAAGAHI